MVLGWDKVDGVRLEKVSEFKYLRCVWMNECRRKVTSRRNVAGAVRSLINAMDLQRVQYEGLFVPVLLYVS